MFSLIDTHCHLDQLSDINSALEDAKNSGVGAIIAVGTDYNSNVKNLEVAHNNTTIKIFLAFGIHPTEIKSEEIEKSLKFFRDNINDAVAIGEIGLDYWRKEIKKAPEAKELQKKVFISQLNLAKEFDLPVIIHSRGTWKDCCDFTLAAGVKKAVFHWYSGPLDILKEILKENFFISATPALYYSEQHQQAVKYASLDNILIETDSPVFYQNNEAGFRAGPKDVTRTLSLLARLKEMPESEVKSRTAENAVKFFNLEKHG